MIASNSHYYCKLNGLFTQPKLGFDQEKRGLTSQNGRSTSTGPFNWVRTNQKGDCPAKKMSLWTKFKRLLRGANVGFAAIMSNPGKILIVLDRCFFWWFPHAVPIYVPYIWLGKLQYFTNLNCWAIKGDDFPKANHDSRVRENSEVVIIYPDV